MLPQVKEDVINVLDLSLNALKKEQHQDLGEISNHIIHDASVFQDDDSLSVAVLIYALSKIVQRCCEKGISYSPVISSLETARDALKKDDFGRYNSSIQNVFKFITKIDSKIKLYIQEVIERAKIKKGSKLHEHGLSIARTAEILGISQWELTEYISKVSYETVKESVNVKERLKRARELFS
ncbi:MAG: hypothetical protein AABX39_04025 [Nanoarchaeota archaeon]